MTRMRKFQADATSAKRKVFVVDDHPFIHAQFKVLLSGQTDLEYCGGARSWRDAQQALARVHADAAVVDLILEDDHGIDLIRELVRTHPYLPIIAFSSADERTYARRVLRAGARGFVSKTASLGAIVTAVRLVLSGGVAIKEELKNELVLAATRTNAVIATLEQRLSDRELQVFQLLGAGKETSEIATTLKVGIKTVETYRARLKIKLELPNNTALLRASFQFHAQKNG